MALCTPLRSRRTDPGPLAVATTLVLAAGAWVAVVVGHRPAGASHAHHGGASTTTVAVALVGWTLMVLAMMLPPAIPLVRLLAGLLAGRARVTFRLLAALAAFAAVWVVVGAVLVSGAAVVDLVLGDVGPSARARLAGGVVLVAGLYQFSPVKDACLTACRSPRWFALRLWGRRGPAVDAAAMAGAYGVSCVGCCWALMALCLGTGAIALPVMVALSVVMAAERLVPRARAVARATGVVLALLGTALLAGLLPPALVHPLLGA
jgi:predicted metal-binding membrane protein